MQIARCPVWAAPLKKPNQTSTSRFGSSDAFNISQASEEQLPEGSTGPVLVSKHARFIKDLKPGKIKSFLIPNINTDNRNFDKLVTPNDSNPVIVFYAHLGDSIKIALRQIKGNQFTPFQAILKLPMQARMLWPQVEIARTKGNQVVVVDDYSVNLRAILHSVAGSAQFLKPNSDQVTLKIMGINPCTPLIIPPCVNDTPLLKKNFQEVIKQAVIPAAGLGTRLQPYAKCKPLIELAGGKTVIEHLVENCINQGVERILIPVHKDTQKEFNTILQPYILRKQVQLLPEELSGDAGGLIKYLQKSQTIAEPFIRLDEPLLQIFGDAVTGLDINRIASKWKDLQEGGEKNPFVSIITKQYPLQDKDVLKKYGIALTRKGSPDGPIKHLLEKPGEVEALLDQGGIYGNLAVDSGNLTVHTGMSVLSPKFLQWLQKGTPGFVQDKIINFGQLFFHLLQDGHPLNAISMEESWVDGGNGIDLNKGRADVFQGKIPTLLTREELESNIAPGYEGVFFNKGTRESALSWIKPFKGNTTIQWIPNKPPSAKASLRWKPTFFKPMSLNCLSPLMRLSQQNVPSIGFRSL